MLHCETCNFVNWTNEFVQFLVFGYIINLTLYLINFRRLQIYLGTACTKHCKLPRNYCHVLQRLRGNWIFSIIYFINLNCFLLSEVSGIFIFNCFTVWLFLCLIVVLTLSSQLILDPHLPKKRKRGHGDSQEDAQERFPKLNHLNVLSGIFHMNVYFNMRLIKIKWTLVFTLFNRAWCLIFWYVNHFINNIYCNAIQ